MNIAEQEIKKIEEKIEVLEEQVRKNREIFNKINLFLDGSRTCCNACETI